MNSEKKIKIEYQTIEKGEINLKLQNNLLRQLKLYVHVVSCHNKYT